MNSLKKCWWLLLLAVTTLNLSGCNGILDKLDIATLSKDQSEAQGQKNQTDLPTEYDGTY